MFSIFLGVLKLKNMEYYPNNFDIEMQKFFNRRRIALNRLKSLGLSLPYISEKFTYEQLLANHSILDISNTETEYLKHGIEEIFKCLRAVQSEKIITSAEAERKVIEDKELDVFIAKQGKTEELQQYIDTLVERLISQDISSKTTTEEVLKNEISEFKTRLGRVNVLVVLENDVLSFKKSENMTELHIYEREILENPYPHIFVDVGAFLLFQDLHSIFKDLGDPLANYSFIYRQMAEKDKLIKESFKPEKFREWINTEPYNTDVNTKFKTYDQCHPKKKYVIYQYVKKKQQYYVLRNKIIT